MKEILLGYVPKKFRFAPRWTIFLLDLSCVGLALSLTILLFNNFDLEQIAVEYPLFNSYLATILLNAVLLFGFKAYKGIVRYTTFEDAGRILLINFLVCVILYVMEFVYSRTIEHRGILILPFSNLVIYFLFVSFLQILYRLGVKRVFAYLFVNKRKTHKAVIFNARNEGRLVGKMISENASSTLKIVGFLDENTKIIGKKIENIPVLRLSYNNLQRLKKENINLLIIADPYIRKTKLNELVDLCLDLDIKVQLVPSSEKWINNQLDLGQLKDVNIEQLLEREEINLENEEIAKEIKGNRVVVTGAAGSIGSEIVRQILALEPSVLIAIDNAETPLHELRLTIDDQHAHKNTKIVYFVGDICDRVRMEQVFEIYQPEIVYHAAAYKHVPLMEESPSVAVKNNVMGTKNLAELAVEYHADKFVMVSTDKAVNPTNVMGASKRIAEIFAQSYYLHLQHQFERGERKHLTKFITTRFGNVLGSNGSVIPRFTKQLREGGPITVTDPEITRYFMTIPEACRLVMEAGSMGNGGEIFVFDMGDPVKIVDLARKMIRLDGKMPERDIKIVFTGLRPGEKLYEELLNNSENTLPTHHKKILIAKVREYDFAEIYNQIEQLLVRANHHTNMNTVAKMKEIVPEFISQNSIYQSLDRK